MYSAMIFCFCLAVYWLNGQYAIASSDSFPNSLLAFNLLENHTLHFDFLRSSPLFHGLRSPYFLIESDSGHLTSAYPIGPAILTFPLYVVFFLIVKFQAVLQGNPVIDLSSDGFFLTRLFYEKVAASLIATLTVVIFYRSVRLKFADWIACLSTLIFAFATSMWTISAQALWQHGPITLLLTLSLWSLLKANQLEQPNQRIRYLLMVGLACGLLPGIRPTATLFSLTIVAYSIYAYRFQAIWLLPGLGAHLPSLIWNFYYFGNAQGGYEFTNQALIDYGTPAYSIAPKRLWQGFTGLLFSPSRGLITFSPIVLYALGGLKPLWQQRWQRDVQLLISLTISIGVLFFSYCAYFMWWAGGCYGARFLVDGLPIVCYLISYGLANMPRQGQWQWRLWRWGVFGVALVYSILIQAIGAFGQTGARWDYAPPMVHPIADQSRFWDVQDSRVARGFWGLVQEWMPSQTGLSSTTVQGKIITITDNRSLPISEPILGKSLGPVVIELMGKVLNVSVQNTGTATWYGYRAALSKGEVQVRGQLFNTANQMVQETRFYIRDNTLPGGQAQAIGFVPFPDVSGSYRLVLDLISDGVGALANSQWHDASGQPQAISLQNQGWRQYQQKIRVMGSKISDRIVQPNSDFKIPLQITNQSNFVWRSQGLYPANLSYRWLRSDHREVPQAGIRTPLISSIPVGHTANLEARIKAPTQSGQYKLVISMLEEGNNWFDRLGAEKLSLNVQIQTQFQT